jgi:hypothetical protein
MAMEYTSSPVEQPACQISIEKRITKHGGDFDRQIAEQYPEKNLVNKHPVQHLGHAGQTGKGQPVMQAPPHMGFRIAPEVIPVLPVDRLHQQVALNVVVFDRGRQIGVDHRCSHTRSSDRSLSVSTGLVK